MVPSHIIIHFVANPDVMLLSVLPFLLPHIIVSLSLSCLCNLPIFGRFFKGQIGHGPAPFSIAPLAFHTRLCGAPEVAPRIGLRWP